MSASDGCAGGADCDVAGAGGDALLRNVACGEVLEVDEQKCKAHRAHLAQY
jgi:hypothetical protein